MRREVEITEARRLIAGGPIVLVTTCWRGNHNVMPAAYVMPLSFEPPLIGLAVHPSRHTHDMITYGEEFALNVPGKRLLHHCQYLGSVSGLQLDKFELTRLPTFKARRISPLLIEGCVAYIECGLEDSFRVGDHTLFIGKVVAAQVEADAFRETWLLEDDDLKPLHYLGLNYYALLGERLEARVPKPEEVQADIEAGVAIPGGEEAQEEREREERERQRRAEEEERYGA